MVSIDGDILEHMMVAPETMAGVTLSPARDGVVGYGDGGVGYLRVDHGLGNIFALNLHRKVTSSFNCNK